MYKGEQEMRKERNLPNLIHVYDLFLVVFVVLWLEKYKIKKKKIERNTGKSYLSLACNSAPTSTFRGFLKSHSKENAESPGVIKSGSF